MAPDIKTADLHQFRCASDKNLFSVALPEPPLSSREMNDVRFTGGTAGWGEYRAELRLRVLRSLPARHQRYLFDEIRKLCRDFLRSQHVPPAEMTPEELLSEIWQKLLGAVSTNNKETPDLSSLDPNQASINADAPESDGRVVWLIDQMGGSVALAHRREDILRRRFGRATAGSGRRMVQPPNDSEFAEIISDADAPSGLEAADSRRIWRGLLMTAELQFQRSDDVSMLLRLLAENPGILQDSPSVQWPIAELIAKLNRRYPPPSWTGDRVDNAKRRLMNWIKRLKRKNGLDDVELEALFARVARAQERSGQTSPTRLHDQLNPQTQ